MLKYFRRERSHCSMDDGSKSENGAAGTCSARRRESLKSTSDELFLEYNTSNDANKRNRSATSQAANAEAEEDIFHYHSRLSMTLPNIMKDQNCLGHFLQYMEAKNALPLIKFYLETDNFRISACAELELDQNAGNGDSATVAQLHVEQHKQRETIPDKSETKSSVPDLRTLCDLTMRKSLTDDEKCDMYIEKAKKLGIVPTSDTCKSVASVADLSTESLMNCNASSTASLNDIMIIYQKYLLANSQQFVSLPITILSQISLLLCRRQRWRSDSVAAVESSDKYAHCFTEAQQYILKQLEADYLPDFLQSSYYCNYCIELIENANTNENENDTKLNIFDILYSETVLFFFMEFLEQRKERDCLDFWIAAINFRKSYSHVTQKVTSPEKPEARTDAMVIYEKYFSLQSEYRLELCDPVRCWVEERICNEWAEMGKCFDLPLLIIAKYLQRKYVQSFLESQLLINYLKVLKSKVQEELLLALEGNDETNSNNNNNNKALPMEKCGAITKMHSRHHKSSDCTDSVPRNTKCRPISEYNTLLAMETPHHAHDAPKQTVAGATTVATTSDLSVDFLQHRKNGLKFGQIDALGRYERDFNEVVCSNKSHSWSLSASGNKLKNAVRKLVNLPEEKVQEEIAWQIAEMIVKDVTNVTLCDDK